MINSFIVKALPENNRLVVLLDGYFMKSEIDLALHLIAKEAERLASGFGVFLDVQNMDVLKRDYPKYLKWISDEIKKFDCGEIVLKGTSDRSFLRPQHYVGFYPNEIGWNLL